MIDEFIPLPEAAHRLGMKWREMYDLVLTRAVRAERRNGRWYVAEEDIEAREQEAGSAG